MPRTGRIMARITFAVLPPRLSVQRDLQTLGSIAQPFCHAYARLGTRSEPCARPVKAELMTLAGPHHHYPRPFSTPDRAGDAIATRLLGGRTCPAIVIGDAPGGRDSLYLSARAQHIRTGLRALLGDARGAFGPEPFAASAVPLADLGPGLRQTRPAFAIATALIDLGGRLAAGTVTQALTDLAADRVDACIGTPVAAEITRGNCRQCRRWRRKPAGE